LRRPPSAKTTDKVSVQLYGKINRMVESWDGGGETNTKEAEGCEDIHGRDGWWCFRPCSPATYPRSRQAPILVYPTTNRASSPPRPNQNQRRVATQRGLRGRKQSWPPARRPSLQEPKALAYGLPSESCAEPAPLAPYIRIRPPSLLLTHLLGDPGLLGPTGRPHGSQEPRPREGR
jgi:hypothetical protein